MSVPYGAPQPHPQQPGVPGQPGNAPNLTFILSLVAAGLGLVAFLCGFAADARGAGSSAYLLGGAVLAGFSVLPKAPKLLWAAVPLSVVAALGMLQTMITASTITGMFVVIFIVSLLQAGAVVVALLADIEVIKLQPKPQYGPPGGWNPASGGFPQPYGQQPGQFPQQGYPQQPQQPQQTQQFGQPGTPPGGFQQS
ncbi:DUF5336 domain-containing protein [Allokutzneria sp. A3M-2-11 16]|uniref:DUF5336 domain-containing protein n=1 Tax=Allokutzneria sp. A3M-2-11 16 TaxID=2962043 RepID=UPI0020B7062A|nr:DUF5336 domain-containing protein [Allokutzneria sp. A3M-2-11 16]MCP3798782.1 DUF5336 domain-containing protein [Allokutzneria sp. A3M-2-11 16]